MAALPHPRLADEVLWRPLLEGDIAYVAALESQIHAAPWTAGNFRDALAAGYCARVGERGGRIVAYGVLMLGPGEAQLLNLSVVPDARRAGLGRTLLRQFADDARRRGAAHVFLEVRVSNAPAIALYLQEGYAAVGRRTGYYPPGADGSREDALVLRRELTGRADRGDA